MNLRRKRMILMRDVWYGYNRTASGNPVTLDAAKRLRQLTIYGNAVQSNLPSGYTEVGYIESSGTQYIDTGVCPTNNTKVEVVFSADKNSVFVYGSRTQGNANANHSFCIEGAVVGYFQFGTSLVASSQVISFNSKHTVIISQDGGYFNGELKQSYDTMSFESTVSMYLCGLNYSGSVDSRMFVGKIYSFRVWESGELIQSLVPCKRDSDGAVGMYDTVTGAFLTNSGTGVFAAGAAVTPTPDTPVDIQLCGDRTGNLCPVSKGTETNFSLETPVVEGETYTFSFVADSVSAGHTSVGMNLKLNTVSGTQQMPGFACPIGSRYVGSFTATGSGTLFVNGFWTQSFSQIQVLKGSYTAETIPDYEPYGYKVSGRVEGDGEPPQEFTVYLPHQIAKVGDVADTVVLDMEKRTAELVQNIRRYDFTGSETIITQENTAYPGGKRFIVQRLALELKPKRHTVTCNRLKQHVNMNNTDNTIFANNNDFYIYYSAMDTVDDFKDFLASNPTYAYVKYAAPVTTDITAMQDWDAMPQVKGTVTLTLSAEVPPSGAEAVYYSAERGD